MRLHPLIQNSRILILGSASLMLGLAGVAAKAQADDGLFSRVVIESVFADKSEATSSRSAAEGLAANRVTTASGLAEKLQNAGFSPEIAGSNRVNVKLKSTAAANNKSDEASSLELTLEINLDLDQVELQMNLAPITDEATVSGQRLLELLNVTRSQRNIALTYDPQSRMLQFRTQVSNLGLTADVISEHVRRLQTLAEGSRASWSGLAESNSKPASSVTLNESKAPAIETQTPSAASLAGTWSAEQSSDTAFALRLQADGSFALAAVAAGKSSTSRGKFSISGDRLSLVGGNGTKLAGKLSQISPDRFDLTLDRSGTRLSFRRSK